MVTFWDPLEIVRCLSGLQKRAVLNFGPLERQHGRSRGRQCDSASVYIITGVRHLWSSVCQLQLELKEINTANRADPACETERNAVPEWIARRNCQHLVEKSGVS